MITVNELAAKALELCKLKDWSLHWTARGCYLHLESSELIEAVRGKGPDPVVKEAADVLIVLMSITENEGLKFSDVMLKAEEIIKRQTAGRTVELVTIDEKTVKKSCKNCLVSMPIGGPEICEKCAAEIAGARVRCSKCGKVPGEFPRAKYCGDGSDKDNGHFWQKIEPSPVAEVDPPPSSVVDQERISKIIGSEMVSKIAGSEMVKVLSPSFVDVVSSTRHIWDGRKEITLIEFHDSPRFADRCRYEPRPSGLLFSIMDGSHVHYQARVGDSVSPSPAGAIGAVKKGEKWFWVVEKTP